MVGNLLQAGVLEFDDEVFAGDVICLAFACLFFCILDMLALWK